MLVIRRLGEHMGRTEGQSDVVTVPVRYPTAAIFVDESGSKTTAGQCFVIAAVKLRNPGALGRAIRDVRDRSQYLQEFKFSRVGRGNYPVFCDLVDTVAASDAHIAACVVDGRVHNPFRGKRPVWQVHAEVISQLLVGCINRRELVGVLLDGISTPRGYSLEDTVRKMTNSRLGATSVVSAVALDSRSNDILQVADLVAGAIYHERNRAAAPAGRPDSHRSKVALRLGAALGRPNMADGRDGRVNIATYHQRKPSNAPRLSVVRGTASPA